MDDDLSNIPQNKFPLRVQVVDGDGEQVTEFGGGSGSVPNPLPITASSLPLPTGAATSAKQDTTNTSLSSINGKMTAVDTGAVVIASSALPTGAATAANQTTASSSLSTIATNTTLVSSGATDSVGSLKAGGKYNSTRPTLTDGQRGDHNFDTRVNLAATLFAANSVNSISTVASNADAQATTSTTSRFETVNRDTRYNETSFDRVRNNTEATILSSAARTATTNGADQTNYNGQGVMLTINVTAEAAAETLSLKIQGKDPVSGNYYDITDFGVVYNATTDAPTITRTFVARPGALGADFIGITGNGTSGKAVTLPRTWRPVVTHSASGSFTYSLASTVIL